MKTYRLNTKTTVVIALLCGIFWSCQEEQVLQEDLVAANENFDVKVHNDYLWFSDVATYESTLNTLKDYSEEELDAWEKELGFTSIRSIFRKAVNEDDKYFEALEKLPEEKIQHNFANGIAPHSEFVLQNAELFAFSPDGWFEIDIPYFALHKVLNKDGLIRIGDDIKQYSSNAIKTIHDGNEQKISLLSDISESQLKNDIEVNEVTLYRSDITSSPNSKVISTSSFQVNECTNRKDRYRVRLYEEIIVANKGNLNYEFAHGFRVLSFRHTVQGWQRRFKTGSLAGQVYFSASYGSGGKYISANGRQDEIGWEFYRGMYTYSFRPEIYSSQGEAWGRNGCNCTYNGLY